MKPPAVARREIDAAIRDGARFVACPPRSGVAPSPEAVETEFLRSYRSPLPLGAAISSRRARWYVIATATSREYRVQELLRRDGFEMWVPERIVVRPLGNERRKAREKLRTKGPLLPGYILARFDLSDETWHRIIGTRHVEGVLGARGRPLSLTDAEIEKLHALIRKHGGVVELNADGSVKRDWVMDEAAKIINDALAAGAWAGHVGQYVGVDDKGNINIKLDILGRPQVLAFPEALVLPVEAKALA